MTVGKRLMILNIKKMARNRKIYKSRREKFNRDKRNFKLVFIFGMIALVVLIIKNRMKIYDWFLITFGW